MPGPMHLFHLAVPELYPFIKTSDLTEKKQKAKQQQQKTQPPFFIVLLHFKYYGMFTSCIPALVIN